MAISFPNDDLMAEGRYRSQTFRPLRRDELSRQQNGVIRGRVLGTPLWFARFTTVRMDRYTARSFEALLNSVDGVTNPIYVYDWRAKFPAAYPNSGFTDSGEIGSLPSTTSLTLKSLPADFEITRGDMFHFNDGSQRSLHQAVESVTANGSGVTAEFEVRPALPGFAAVDKAVTFKRPSCRMVIVPDSVEIETEDDFTTITYSAIQTY